jgi:hypothetical protein
MIGHRKVSHDLFLKWLRIFLRNIVAAGRFRRRLLSEHRQVLGFAGRPEEKTWVFLV